MFVFWLFLHERGSRKNPSNLFRSASGDAAVTERRSTSSFPSRPCLGGSQFQGEQDNSILPLRPQFVNARLFDTLPCPLYGFPRLYRRRPPAGLEVLRNAHLNERIGARRQELGKIHTEQSIGQKRRDES